ncbi:hypothetical protein HK105_202572 [Polyrhizophydium stewartii]|uniref:PH domain-containing protein n=1 Tax=Polyrhizophydium stewartii TaxID=2732419 RepID=A0ABR4NE01_9FUNG
MNDCGEISPETMSWRVFATFMGNICSGVNLESVTVVTDDNTQTGPRLIFVADTVVLQATDGNTQPLAFEALFGARRPGPEPARPRPGGRSDSDTESDDSNDDIGTGAELLRTSIQRLGLAPMAQAQTEAASTPGAESPAVRASAPHISLDCDGDVMLALTFRVDNTAREPRRQLVILRERGEHIVPIRMQPLAGRPMLYSWTWKLGRPSITSSLPLPWRENIAFASQGPDGQIQQHLAIFFVATPTSFWPPLPEKTSQLSLSRRHAPPSRDATQTGAGRERLADNSVLPRRETTISAQGSQGTASSASGSAAVGSWGVAAFEDGPLFRATLSEFEGKTATLKQSIKRVLKSADALLELSRARQAAEKAFVEAAMQLPLLSQAMRSYLESASEILASQAEMSSSHFQTLLIDPLRGLYTREVKYAERRKKEFEQESQDYQAFEQKYLSIRNDDKKKRLQLDAKFQSKRRSFELKCFDYYQQLTEMHGQQMEMEIGFLFSNFAEKQTAQFGAVANRLGEKRPELDEIVAQLTHMTKAIHQRRKDVQEQRKAIEARTTSSLSGQLVASSSMEKIGFDPSDTSIDGLLAHSAGRNSQCTQPGAKAGEISRVRTTHEGPQHDLDAARLGRKREGFLFVASSGASSSPIPVSGSASNLAWRKSCNWKNLGESAGVSVVNLRFCSVREARNVDRRFCFEILSAQNTRRIYQATDDDDLKAWVSVVQNAIEAMLNGTAEEIDDSPVGGSRQSTLESQQAASDTILSQLWAADSSNMFCADCGHRQPDWSSINLGCLVCKATLDTASWTRETLGVVCAIGNSLSNSVWESQQVVKPRATDRLEVKSAYIKDKVG